MSSFACLFVCVEFDTLTGCRIASIDIGSPVVRMAYSPTSSHSVVAILEVPCLWMLFSLLICLGSFCLRLVGLNGVMNVSVCVCVNIVGLHNSVVWFW